MNRQENREIQISICNKEVMKRYNCENSFYKYSKIKFLRELRAYKFFNSLKVDFVPKLIGYDTSLCYLIIENIRGNTLRDVIEEGDFNAYEIISNIIGVDRSLYRKKINYMHSSADDILVTKDRKRIYIIDFEYTFINEYFQQILYDCLFGSRMMRIKNQIGRDKFIEILKKRKHEFESYYFRKAKNILISSLGVMRRKERVEMKM